MRVLYTAEKPMKVKVSTHEPGSLESVVLPPARPRRKVPPGFGVASSAWPGSGRPREKRPGDGRCGRAVLEEIPARQAAVEDGVRIVLVVIAHGICPC